MLRLSKLRQLKLHQLKLHQLALLMTFALVSSHTVACSGDVTEPVGDSPIAEAPDAVDEADVAAEDADEDRPSDADDDEPTSGPTPTRAPTADILATATAVAELRARSGFDVPLEDFVAELEVRVLGRDWAGLATLAANPIAVAPYASEWQELSAGRLVSELGTFYLPEGADPAFSPPETDIAALLGGMDPTAMLGPDVKVAQVIHSTGWGLRGSDEVLLFVSEPPEGGYRWEALLWSSGSFPGP